MSPEPTILTTDIDGLNLKQMLTQEDDQQYLALQNANADYWKEFGNAIDEDVAATTKRRLQHGNGRFGIWFGDKLVGMVGYSTEGHEHEAEMGILLAQAATGKGYATAAFKTLTTYALPRFDRVFAEVEPDNARSISLMNRTGFTTNNKVVERDWGKALVFECSRS